MPPKKRRAPGAGAVRQLPSGRWQGRFRGPDGVMRAAPCTFDTKLDADAWLRAQGAEVERGAWSPPEQRGTSGRQTLAQYAQAWLATRDLKPRTRHEYQRLLDSVILPGLGSSRVDTLSPTTIRNWYASLDPAKPTQRARAYGVLRAIFTTVLADGLRTDQPCRVHGGGQTKRAKAVRPASLKELETITAAMPPRYRPMVLLASWCALRFGELAGLRRQDVDIKAGVVRVQQGVTRTPGQVHVGDPKSEAGKRPVAIPPHLLPLLAEHLEQHVGAAPQALVFPARSGEHMAPSSLYKVWYPARDAAGRSDLRFHDLRHTGATLAAATGATLAELMARLGHSTPKAALVYQHVAADRDRAIALALSGLVAKA